MASIDDAAADAADAGRRRRRRRPTPTRRRANHERRVDAVAIADDADTTGAIATQRGGAPEALGARQSGVNAPASPSTSAARSTAASSERSLARCSPPLPPCRTACSTEGCASSAPPRCAPASASAASWPRTTAASALSSARAHEGRAESLRRRLWLWRRGRAAWLRSPDAAGAVGVSQSASPAGRRARQRTALRLLLGPLARRPRDGGTRRGGEGGGAAAAVGAAGPASGSRCRKCRSRSKPSFSTRRARRLRAPAPPLRRRPTSKEATRRRSVTRGRVSRVSKFLSAL